jgi:hypothetical protein
MTTAIGPKHPDEIKVVSFEFSTELEAGETISSALVTATTKIGGDASPSAILLSAPQISGTKILQRVQAGVQGCVYSLKAKATGNGGLVHVIAADLEVSPS